MADSDGEYVQGLSDDEGNIRGSRNRHKTRSSRQRGGQQADKQWEVRRTWEEVVEGADGRISSTIEGLLEASKRKRILHDTTPVQRGVIRHLILVLDLSSAMMEKDLRPTRYLLTLRYAQEFITEFFEQNPISQLGVMGMRDGLCIKISDMSGNATEHITAIEAFRAQEPKGDPSLQNALEMARSVLFNAPSHGTREVLVIYGALLTSDPGDIHVTISDLVEASIRVRIVGLAAQVAICREMVSRTNGGDDSGYGVALNEGHFRDLFMDNTIPPVTLADKDKDSTRPLLEMGFPSRITESEATLCACHSRLTKTGYQCPRCMTKVCDLPATCPGCDQTLVLSIHLARSYHHLYPLLNWVEVPWSEINNLVKCPACLALFPKVPPKEKWSQNKLVGKDVSESGRYKCPACQWQMCSACDAFYHEIVHNCPGCLNKPQV
ncbi:MAG: hypothetical protein M1834_005809 [Cirrosporium novae-zelandiae]|nr:MAG: hypothetical protein M1834_005809 [Cirrosporium novae-zelandiae]